MAKITENTYRLPIINALSSFGLFEMGTTAPMRIRGVDTITGERGQYVVKYRNHSRMSESATANEFLGAWMALELGLNAAEPVVVNISEDFVSTLAGRDGYKAARQSTGLNFGTKYESGITQIQPSGFSFSEKQLFQAKQLFVFDQFIQNTDRGHQRPNLGLLRDDLFVYDHELAFSFLLQLPFTRSKTPWFIEPTDAELYKKHFFYPYLKGQGEDFSVPVNELKCFNSDFWSSIETNLPEDFKVDKVVEIKEYLLPFLEHLDEFEGSITKIMSS